MITFIGTSKVRRQVYKKLQMIFLPNCIKSSLNSSKNKEMCYYRGQYISKQFTSKQTTLVEFCRVNTGVKLVWIPGVRFDTGVLHRCYTHLFCVTGRVSHEYSEPFVFSNFWGVSYWFNSRVLYQGHSRIDSIFFCLLLCYFIYISLF